MMRAENNSNHSAAELEIGYWTIRGLGAPCRMMASYANVKYFAACYDSVPIDGAGIAGDASSFSKDGWKKIKPSLREKHPLINLPYVIDYADGKEIIVTQTNAVLAYLGRRLNLWGDNREEASQCEQLLSEAMDLRNGMTKHAYPKGDDVEATKALFLYQTKAGSLRKLNAWLEKKGDDSFFVGSKASAPDFHIFEMCEQYAGLAERFQLPNPLGSHLQNFHQKFAALPQNRSYLASKLHAMPFNNKHAKFGADSPANGNGPWTTGQPYEWTRNETSGVY